MDRAEVDGYDLAHRLVRCRDEYVLARGKVYGHAAYRPIRGEVVSKDGLGGFRNSNAGASAATPQI